jgi:hypothetical protein
MSPDEWRDIVKQRMNALWSPAMTGEAVAAYYDTLERLPGSAIRAALADIARTSDRRPSAKLLYETASAKVAAQDGARAALPALDPVPVEHHGALVAEIRRSQSDEHGRRAAAVQATGKRFTMAQLRQLLPEQSCGPEEFDRRLAEWALSAPTTSRPEPVPMARQRRMLGDPEDDW